MSDVSYPSQNVIKQKQNTGIWKHNSNNARDLQPTLNLNNLRNIRLIIYASHTVFETFLGRSNTSRTTEQRQCCCSKGRWYGGDWSKGWWIHWAGSQSIGTNVWWSTQRFAGECLNRIFHLFFCLFVLLKLLEPEHDIKFTLKDRKFPPMVKLFYWICIRCWTFSKTHRCIDRNHLHLI